MLIIGAKGFAKEVLEVCFQNKELAHLAFYDDLNQDVIGPLYNEFPILKNIKAVIAYFKEVDNRFTLGIGNPMLRAQLYEQFSKLGGVFTSTISTTAIIGHYGNVISEGCNIMQQVVLTNDIYVGKGVIINQISSIGHDVVLGDFVELCPDVSVSGNCIIGSQTFVGTGAVILPQIKVGKNVKIGAGAVVSKDLPDNCVAVGIPAKIIKQD